MRERQVTMTAGNSASDGRAAGKMTAKKKKTTTAKKTDGKKRAAKKTAGKKKTGKKRVAEKTPARKPPAKKTPARKPPAKKTPAKKAPAKKATAKKTTAKRTTAKKRAAGKASVRKKPTGKRTGIKKPPDWQILAVKAEAEEPAAERTSEPEAETAFEPGGAMASEPGAETAFEPGGATASELGAETASETTSETAAEAAATEEPKAAAGGAGMKRLQSAESQRRFSRQMREEAKRIGFVPTMGAFHEGHLTLMRKARGQNDVVVVSIFVNPLQFGPGEDYEKYPRDLARDLDKARAEGVDAVFIPEPAEMYPPGFSTKISVGPMADKLCGAQRPGHFDGVCTVVLKLLGIVQPHRLYVGQKDAQQAILLQKMLIDLDVDVRTTVVPTQRDKDGLAMSSRNRYLNEEERAMAPRLYEALRLAQREILVGGERDPKALAARMRDLILSGTKFEIEYLEMVDPETLDPRPILTGRLLIAIAARLGPARLIDNLQINVPGGRMAERFAHRH